MACCPNITDTSIIALISHEHNDPQLPYPALPNLASLDLSKCSITEQGLVTLSKSQLLDQIEDLSLDNQPHIHSSNGANTLLQTTLFSNMNWMWLDRVDEQHIDSQDFSHFDNCEVSWRNR